MNSTTFFTPTSLGIDQNSASHKDKFTNTMSIKKSKNPSHDNEDIPWYGS